MEIILFGLLLLSVTLGYIVRIFYVKNRNLETHVDDLYAQLIQSFNVTGSREMYIQVLNQQLTDMIADIKENDVIKIYESDEFLAASVAQLIAVTDSLTDIISTYNDEITN